MRVDPVAQLEFDRRSLNILKELGDLRIQAVALGNVGVAWLNLGQPAQARRDLEEALRLLRATGDRAVEGNVLCNLSLLALAREDGALARALARSAAEIAAAVEAQELEVDALVALGDAEAGHDRAAAARAYAQAKARAADLGPEWRHAAAARAGPAGPLARRYRARGARAEELLADAADGNAGDLNREMELTCHRVLMAAGAAAADATGSIAPTATC